MSTENKIEMLELGQHKLDKGQVAMAADIRHIKERLDNGMSKTIDKIWVKINEMVPSVIDNTYWVGKIKWAVTWITVIIVGGGLGRLIWHWIGKLIGG